jgi:hypothetical protein
MLGCTNPKIREANPKTTACNTGLSEWHLNELNRLALFMNEPKHLTRYENHFQGGHTTNVRYCADHVSVKAGWCAVLCRIYSVSM